MQDTRRKYIIKIFESFLCDNWTGLDEIEARYCTSENITMDYPIAVDGGWDITFCMVIWSHPATIKDDVDAALNQYEWRTRPVCMFSVYDDNGERALTEEDFE